MGKREAAERASGSGMVVEGLEERWRGRVRARDLNWYVPDDGRCRAEAEVWRRLGPTRLSLTRAAHNNYCALKDNKETTLRTRRSHQFLSCTLSSEYPRKVLSMFSGGPTTEHCA